MTKKNLPLLAVAAALIAMVAAGLLIPRHTTPQMPSILPSAAYADTPAPGEVVLLFSIGGVLTRDGTLWIYRPDLDQWLNIDEAFRQEGQETHILPLPVPVEEIAEMETYGFILTRQGEVWFYEISTDEWRKLKGPGSS